ncbi:MAG: sigma-70 family RNA polymerase sigma factor [Clostridiaceae bacterium]|nr:sigma-70 family RNA polymerase sigma factor [Clostridiales bacterium]MDD2441127.1 sigma-70 family RNA polymerase sigma factor [Eubacteriales bacterium]MDD4139128.1 sigma-70 family RNA polymerase sigma factor [Eubacteriales bacterium]MDD4743965.1 sigma-70 family RNA polymerase sigma factor [Eubacteriales bacterium]NLB45106.1 sigma-70 family RNA polymerase sigma factor [Clostridiaceae bacterium]
MTAASDQLLLDQAARGDSLAVDQLLTRYKGLVRQKASVMYMAGADAEDVIQEGMIGLYKAIRAYKPEKEVPFPSFAAYCIMSQITDAVRKAARLKHQMLTHSISLQSLAHETEDGTAIPAAAFIPARPEANPEQVLLNREELTDLMRFVQKELSQLERQSMLLFLQSLTYKQIAACLEVPQKTVDNALGRARRKFLQYRQRKQQTERDES